MADALKKANKQEKLKAIQAEQLRQMNAKREASLKEVVDSR